MELLELKDVDFSDNDMVFFSGEVKRDGVVKYTSKGETKFKYQLMLEITEGPNAGKGVFCDMFLTLKAWPNTLRCLKSALGFTGEVVTDLKGWSCVGKICRFGVREEEGSDGIFRLKASIFGKSKVATDSDWESIAAMHGEAAPPPTAKPKPMPTKPAPAPVAAADDSPDDLPF